MDHLDPGQAPNATYLFVSFEFWFWSLLFDESELLLPELLSPGVVAPPWSLLLLLVLLKLPEPLVLELVLELVSIEPLVCPLVSLPETFWSEVPPRFSREAQPLAARSPAIANTAINFFIISPFTVSR